MRYTWKTHSDHLCVGGSEFQRGENDSEAMVRMDMEHGPRWLFRWTWNWLRRPGTSRVSKVDLKNKKSLVLFVSLSTTTHFPFCIDVLCGSTRILPLSFNLLGPKLDTSRFTRQ